MYNSSGPPIHNYNFLGSNSNSNSNKDKDVSSNNQTKTWSPVKTNNIIASPFPLTPGGLYQKIPISKQTYLAYVVVIRDSLNFHLDIYCPEKIKKKYDNVINYTYDFKSEELGDQVYSRQAYSCHLKGVEIIIDDNDSSNVKEAHAFVTKKISRTNGWVLVSIGDIDIYRRILITLFDIITRKNINDEILAKKSSKSQKPIAKEYSRPIRNKNPYTPMVEKKDYRIIYNGAN